jgi:serine phosphatase RsbU (regulator of sigma subunit)
MSMLFAQADGLLGPSFSFVILFVALAISAFILWFRYQSRRRLVRRIIELEALSDAGRAMVTAQLDIIALCELIASEAGRIVDNRTFQIGLFEDSRYVILYWTIDGQKQSTPRSFDIANKQGLIGWIGESKRSLLVSDFEKEMESLPAKPTYLSQQPPRSAVFIPLVVGSEAIGVLASQSDKPKAFSKQEFGLLTVLANQAAAAIANGQLYERERTRAAHLELVGQIARQVNAISDLDELFSSIVQLTQETFGFGSVNIFGIDDPTGDAIIRASSVDGIQAGSIQLTSGQGLIGEAISTRVTTLSGNTLEDPRFQTGSLSARTQSEISIPLIVNSELLGVLDVQSEDGHAFDYQEQTVLEALAAQVAIAINKAQQFDRQRQQAWITTAQLQVAETISDSPDLDTLTERIVRLTPLLSGVSMCAILLRDEEAAAYHGAALFDGHGKFEEEFHQFIVEEGEWHALDAARIGRDAYTSSKPPPWVSEGEEPSTRQPELALTTLLPLLFKGRELGVMVVIGQNIADESLKGRTGGLLRNIANQTAQAVDRFQLQNARQEEAWVNTALLQVAEAVNKLTDLNEILYTIVRMVPMLVGVKACVIMIWDEEQGTYHAGPSYGLSEMGHGLLESFDVDFSEFPLIETQDMERVGPDATSYTFKLPGWLDTILGSDTANIFPLYARARLVGALVVGPADNSRPITGRRLNIITGIAQQAAIAVVNDQLYKESAERGRLEQELDVARSIQASLMPSGDPDVPGCTIGSFWQAARQVSGDFYDFMPLTENLWGIAIADVADKGVPAALFMAMSRTILRTVAFNRRNPADVLERSNELIYNDTTSDLFVTVFYAIWNATKQTLAYATGGHPPPILVRKNGEVTLLESDGIALGVLEKVTFSHESVRLNKGDVVVFYTDGVTEAMNEDFDEYDLERLCLVARNSRKGDVHEIIQNITEAVEDHAGGSAQFDDITLVVLKH